MTERSAADRAARRARAAANRAHDTATRINPNRPERAIADGWARTASECADSARAWANAGTQHGDEAAERAAQTAEACEAECHKQQIAAGK